MPQYLISVWHDEDYSDNDWSDPEIQRIGQQVGALNEEMERTGVWVFGAGLQPQSTATVVRVRRRRRVDDRRPLRRDQGADGRLLGHRGSRPRRRPRVGRQVRRRLRGPGGAPAHAERVTA